MGVGTGDGLGGAGLGGDGLGAGEADGTQPVPRDRQQRARRAKSALLAAPEPPSFRLEATTLTHDGIACHPSNPNLWTSLIWAAGERFPSCWRRTDVNLDTRSKRYPGQRSGPLDGLSAALRNDRLQDPNAAGARLADMPQLRIALAQVNPTVGDISANADLVTEWAVEGAEGGAHLVLFPEMVLTGYPVEDLALRRVVRRGLARRSIRRLAARLAERGARRAGGGRGLPRAGPTTRPIPRVVVRRTPRPSCTAAGWSPRYAKHHLPNYGVFDEFRYFVPGDSSPSSGCAASTSPSRSARTSGRTAARSPLPREAGAGLLRGHQRVAVRAGQGRHPRRPGAPPGRRGRLRHSPTSTWSAARTSWSSTATRWSSTAPATVLARGAQFAEELLVVDLELPGARHRTTRERRAG